MNLTRGINLRKIAELMPGASGAEVKVTGVPKGKGAEAGSTGFRAQGQRRLLPCSGRVHRGWHVRAAGAPRPRHAGGL